MVDQRRINDDFATMVGARAQERDAQRIRMEDRPRQSGCQQAAERGGRAIEGFVICGRQSMRGDAGRRARNMGDDGPSETDQ